LSASPPAVHAKRGNRFVRFLRYRFIYIQRHSASPVKLAASVFIGIFSAFLVPAGHPIMAIFLAWGCRCNKTVACLATAIHLPPMYPLTWPLQYAIGSALIPGAPLWQDIESRLMHRQAPMDFLQQLLDMGLPFIAAFTLGGIVIGLALGSTMGFLTYRSITSYRHHRELKRQEIHRAQF
jgi:uncharacterized protein (DUF2062 family)